MESQAQPAEDSALQQEWRERVNLTCAALDVHAYAGSLVVLERWALSVVRRGVEKHLLVCSESEPRAAELSGTPYDVPSRKTPVRVTLCPLTPDNAATLRKHLPFTRPIVPRRGASIGTGDRLGLATPGHVQAIRTSALKPVLAQQSIREMTRTQRTAQEVLDDATWGVLQAGYREGLAADADHLRTIEDVALTVDAGYSMYTIDPGHHVDDSAEQADVSDLAARVEALPWDTLRCTPEDCRRLYADQTVTVSGERQAFQLVVSDRELLRAVVKYGRAIAHAVVLYQYLAGRCAREDFAFELSVDETDTPTSAVEHFYIASELKRLGLQWDGLAPRFVGQFYKGIDYVGDLAEFRTEFAKHVLIAQHFGGYKISLHSGSDKFSIYPIIAELAGDLIHIKTAGTSYLEALRVVAQAAPDLFREILAFAKQRYGAEKASYHVCADVARIPEPDTLRDEDLPTLFDQSDARQVCHVTFGSVLTSKGPDGSFRFRDDLLSVLKRNEEMYYGLLEEHFLRHISPFR